MSRRKSQKRAKGQQHSKTRNQYALRAHFRHAGAMHDRRQPRGGASDQQQKWLDEYLDEGSCEEEQSEELKEHDDETQLKSDAAKIKKPSKQTRETQNKAHEKKKNRSERK